MNILIEEILICFPFFENEIQYYFFNRLKYHCKEIANHLELYWSKSNNISEWIAIEIIILLIFRNQIHLQGLPSPRISFNDKQFGKVVIQMLSNYSLIDLIYVFKIFCCCKKYQIIMS